jgi:biopolymer transport protein ExbB
MFMNIWEIIRAGGVVMYAIIACSIVALGFIIERFLVFHRSRCNMEKFFPPVENAIKLGKMEEAIQYCEKMPGLIPRVMLIGLKHREEKIEDIRRILIDEIQIHALPTLQKHLSLLATIAKGAPMLGLLGTVWGMMGLFETIGQKGFGDPQYMANDLRFAIGTTVGGLLVAIPILFALSYFKAQIRNFELNIYDCLTRFLRIMRKRQEVS